MGGTQEIIGFFGLFARDNEGNWQVGKLVNWQIAAPRSLCNALYISSVPIAIGMLRPAAETKWNAEGLRFAFENSDT